MVNKLKRWFNTNILGKYYVDDVEVTDDFEILKLQIKHGEWTLEYGGTNISTIRRRGVEIWVNHANWLRGWAGNGVSYDFLSNAEREELGPVVREFLRNNNPSVGDMIK